MCLISSNHASWYPPREYNWVCFVKSPSRPMEQKDRFAYIRCWQGHLDVRKYPQQVGCSACWLLTEKGTQAIELCVILKD